MLSEEWAVFPAYYGGHLKLSFSAILTGLLISVPLGLFAARSKRLAGPSLGVASVIQTIPGIALLALMVPVMGGRIGFWPAYAALALYAVLPVLRNTIVGLQGVDPAVREAALGVGMTKSQRLWQVDLPLAMPVVVAGLRTASVWVVGAATLSTPVGAPSLGNYIFQGLQTRNWTAVIFGCVVSALLALTLDQVIRLFEQASARRRKGPAIAGLVGLCLLAVPAFLSFNQNSGVSSFQAEAGATVPLAGETITIGAKAFTEQYILAELIDQTLADTGARTELKQGLGSAVAFDALARNEIDIMVDYSGTLWASVLKRTDSPPRAMLNAVTSARLLEDYGVLTYAPLGFENAYAFAVSAETAERLNLTSISDLSGKGLSIASDPEFFGLSDMTTRGMDSAFMYDAVMNNEVDVITAYTTDGRIDAYGLVLLEEPLGTLPPYEALILLSPRAAADRALLGALEPLAGALSNETMRAANGKVDLDGESVTEAARWLGETTRK